MVKPPLFHAAGLFLPAAIVLLAESAALGADPPATDGPAAPPAAVAAATPAPSGLKAWEQEKPLRRGGFVVGGLFGFGVSSVVGFPNDPLKTGRARYYTETGTRPGFVGGLWFGGALTDWFTFGVGATAGNMFATGDEKVTTVGFIFHLEGFPLFTLGGRYRDLGVMFDAGLGVASVAPATGSGSNLVDGGGASILGGGVFYEGVRFWKVHGGPFLAGNYYWLDTVRRPAIFLGWRMALYTRSPP